MNENCDKVILEKKLESVPELSSLDVPGGKYRVGME
jgi:hypothetical protein